MLVGDAAAWAAAAIAVIAAFIALGNANSAKRQATAAEKALVETRRSARAAEEQAAAAKEQVEIMRQQIDEQRVARDRPRFEVDAQRFTGETTVPLTIRMVAGADIGRLTIDVGGQHVLGVAGAPDSKIRGSRSINRNDFTAGAETTIWVDLEETLHTVLTVKFTCTARDDGRVWEELAPHTVELMHPTVRDSQIRRH